MSYSRWLTSSWYTFWSSSGGEGKDYQLIEIMYSLDDQKSFYYKDLKENFQNCIDKIEEDFSPSDEEIRELKKYLEEFMRDVEKEFEK